MSTMEVFYTTAPENGMITLPEELRGKPLKIVVEPAKSPVQDLVDFCTNKNERLPDVSSKKGILGLRGILKACTVTDVEDARYEYLMEKYAHHD